MVISGVVQNSGAASGYRLVLILLLILLMLTTSSSTGSTASAAPVPNVLPLTLWRRCLVLLLAIAVTVRHNAYAAGAVDSSGNVILLRFTVRYTAAVVVMMVCRTGCGAVGGCNASGRLDVHRMDISV